MDSLLRGPTRVGLDDDWVDVVAGIDFSCGIKADGRAFCWGQDYAGQLGDGPGGAGGETPREVTVGSGTGWSRLDADDRHVCGLRDDGSLWCWGLNDAGQVGGAEPMHEAPIEPQPGRRFVDVVAGTAHTCAIDAEGWVTCWGLNDDGQLGGFPGASSSSPVPVCAPR